MALETKDIQDIVDSGFKGIEGKLDEKQKAQLEDTKNAVVSLIEAKGYQTPEQVEELIKAKMADLEKVVLELKKSGIGEKKEKESFEDVIGTSLKENKASLAKLTSKQSSEERFILVKANEDLDPANWSNDSYDIAASERRGLHENPFAPIWLRTLLPNSTTSKGTIHYIVENGEVGAAAVWNGDPAIASLTAKPGEAPLFDSKTVNVDWIAGITRVKREMLEDVEWLRSYLARTLTTGRKGLFVAENTLILAALDANSVDYSGSKTIGIEKLVDAAFGQLKNSYYNPSFFLMNNLDVVEFINLNKASGSGEYDVPVGVVAVIGGQLYIGGVPVIGTPIVTVGTAYVVDRNATEFISRMSPEIRAFEEDRDNVIKNLVTFRAEERVAVLVYDENAVIKIDLTETT